MDKANQHQVTSVECTDLSTLIIQFDGVITLSFAGDPGDQNTVEPWQITSDSYKPKILLIALQGGVTRYGNRFWCRINAFILAATIFLLYLSNFFLPKMVT